MLPGQVVISGLHGCLHSGMYEIGSLLQVTDIRMAVLLLSTSIDL